MERKKEIDFGKRLGIGCLRLPIIEAGERMPGFRDDANVDYEAWQPIVDLAMANGYNYFDTSWFYHNGNSERAIGKCVVDKYPRDQIIISDKMPIKFMKSADEFETIFNEQLEKLHTDYMDFYLIHALGHEAYDKWSNAGLFEFLMKKREEGYFREFGMSMHETPEFLDKVLTEHPEVDFVMLQINYLDWESESIRSKECYEVAHIKHGKPIVVMEPCKGGTLANPPEAAAKLMKEYNPDASFASWAYRWVGSLPGVRVVSVGMPKIEFLEDNMKTFDNFTPLNEEEYAIIDKVVEIINDLTAIPCTNCKYCEEACPFDIPAGDYFQLYNDYFRNYVNNTSTDYNDVVTPAVTYGNIIERRAGADKCVGCGKCEKVCPQHLEIIDLLKEKVVEDMGRFDPNTLVKSMVDNF